MNSDRPLTKSSSFFVPIGIGVLVLMSFAGLVTAVTAFGYPVSSQQLPDEPPEIPVVDGSGEPGNSETPPLTTVGGETVLSEPPEIVPGANDDPAVTQTKPLDDVRTRSRILPLAGEGVPDKIALCQILVDDVTQVALELGGSEFSKPRPLTLQLELQPKDTKSCTWSVSQVSASGFAPVQLIGEFVLKDQQFGFHWRANADKGKLPFCRLKISANADTEVCDLWSPVRASALKLNFNKSVQKLPPFVPPGISLPPAESLRLELTFEGWPEHERSGDILMLNETLEVVFPDNASERDLLKILLTLKTDGGQLSVRSSYFTNTPRSPARKGKSEIKYEDRELSHSDLEKLTKEMEREAAKYQRELADVERDLEKLQLAQDNLARQMAPAAEQALLQHRFDQKEEEKTATEELVEAFSDAESAMTTLSDLCSALEGNVVHFRLVRLPNAADPEVVISSSVGVVAADPVDDNP